MGERWTAREFWQAECDRVWEQEYLPNLPYQQADLYSLQEISEMDDLEGDGAPITEAMQQAIDAIGAAVRVGVKK